MAHKPRLARGPGSDFKPQTFAYTPGVEGEGYESRTCLLCPKVLYTEVGIRSHLRSHIRKGELQQSEYTNMVRIVLQRFSRE